MEGGGRRTAAGRRTRTQARSRAEGTTRWDGRALACCVLALVVLAAGLALVLGRTGRHRSGTDGVWIAGDLPAIAVPAGVQACQRHELLPADTAELQIPVERTRSAAVVTLWQHRQLLDRVVTRVDTQAAGLLRAPIGRTLRDAGGVRVCVSFRSGGVLLQGHTVPDVGSIRVGRLQGSTSMAVDYLQSGRSSWWEQAPTIAARLDRGRGDWGEGWIAWLLAGLVASALALAAWVALRAIVGERVSTRTAVAIAAVAALEAAAWSLVTPAFQAPDEGGHVAYVQSIGETGRPPADPRTTWVSPELLATAAGTRFGSIWARTVHTAVWSPVQQRVLAAGLHAPLSRRATTFLGPAEPEPPLYYALAALPYRLGTGATLLDRIALMRLLSALMAGLTALFAFLFVRECLPARPWAWAVGGLGVAFAPMLGFVSGSVNPDALLFTLSAALFLCLARGWQRGMTMRLALGIGALVAVGMLAKANFYALAPGALVALALAARRSAGAWGRRVARLLGAGVGVATAGFALGTGFQVIVWHRPFALGRPPAPESHVPLLSHLSYIWQVFLPRLPIQGRAFHDYPVYDQLFKTLTGVFGPLAIWFPGWVYRLGAFALGAALLLGLRALAQDPRTLRWRRRELLGYTVMAGGIVALVGLSADLRRSIMPIIQGRYLLPLLPLFGALLALGARGAGERWGRSVGVAMVAALVALTVFGQLSTITFFYS